MPKFKVADGYQIAAEDGKVYTAGQTVDAPDDGVSQEWVAAGWAIPAKAVTAAKPKAVKAAKNKAVPASPNKGFVSTPTVVGTPGPIVKKG